MKVPNSWMVDKEKSINEWFVGTPILDILGDHHLKYIRHIGISRDVWGMLWNYRMSWDKGVISQRPWEFVHEGPGIVWGIEPAFPTWETSKWISRSQGKALVTTTLPLGCAIHTMDESSWGYPMGPAVVLHHLRCLGCKSRKSIGWWSNYTNHLLLTMIAIV